MKKNKLLIFLLFLLCLNACKGKGPVYEAPKITGTKDYIFKLNEGNPDDIDLLKNVKAIDPYDGDISDQVICNISNDFTNEIIPSLYDINFSISNRFRLTFSVENSYKVKKEAIQFMIIGNPNKYEIMYGDANRCLATNYIYDHEAIKKDYKLVFKDEFNKKGAPDSKYWRYDLGGGGWGNGEKQYYTNDSKNVKIENGFLKITVLKEQKETNDYTSARIMTTEEASFMYGKWEISASLPKGKGTWPAIWMLPSGNLSWPLDGEIDIMETAYYMQNSVISTVHTNAYNHTKGTQVGNRYYNIPQIYTSQNIYTIEWLPDKIIGYFNDEPYFTFEPQTRKTCPSYNEWPFLQKFRLIMNIAMGGGMGQEIDDNIFENEIAMKVDFVKIYQSEIVKNLKPQ